MTLPAIGFVGLVFLFLFLIAGIAILILLTKHDLRHRLCEALASYRTPSDGKKHKRKKKRKSQDSYIHQLMPGPDQLLQQTDAERAELVRQLSQSDRSNSMSKIPRSNSFGKPQRSNSLSKLRDSGRSSGYSPAYVNNPEKQFAYPGSPLKSSFLSKSKDYLEVPLYPTSGPTSVSSGTSTPQDSSTEKKGILKNSLTASQRNSATKPKSVGYEDQVQTMEIV